MNHIGTQTIETDRLILRKARPEDAQFMFNNWASDDEVTKYLMWQSHKSLIDNYKRPYYYDWLIELKELGEPIGSIGVVELKENVNAVHIGYCIGKKWWHKGITSEALSSLIDFFFNKVGAERIESRHDPRNVNSGKVMQKCGMKYEGTFRKADINNQGVCDAAYYAILKSE